MAAFWNGITWFFVLAGIASVANHVAPGSVPTHLIPKSNGTPIGLTMTIVVLLFMLPFVGVGLLLLWALLGSLFGRIEVRLRSGAGEVRNGIGPLGTRKRFDAGKVRRVQQETRKRKDSEGDSHALTKVVIEADRTLDFGGDLPDHRRRFLTGVLRQTLMRDAA